ncbi:acyl-CoA dehydrogenase family protein [Peribacillus butanolivorans]|uniref:acyl-CoA dehydrogenase family protein n=1 Tax=Peribacillus butanolivorans TaxID=421767 RepID=UPI003686134A
MVKRLELQSEDLSGKTKELRNEVRSFLKEELEKGSFVPHCDSWLSKYDPEFSRKLGQRGWLGMTWPKKYGGHERTALERYVVTEELLAIGAPVAAHWFADRQSGPLLLRYGNESQKAEILPRIARGEVFFSIGLSEANSGSDLASISTSAKKVDKGWLLNGSKVWTSGAHFSHYMMTLCRTSPRTDNRHEGFSQLIVDLSSPGVTIRPIRLMTGEHHFNEVILDDVFIPDRMAVGNIGDGWKQILAELAFERSGPERFLSTFPLFVELIRVLQQDTLDKHHNISIGRLVAHLTTLRELSLGVARLLQKGISPDITAALVKDLGTQFECKVAEVARLLVSLPSQNSNLRFNSLLATAILHSPGFTLRGGTTEILRGIIAKGAGIK